MKKKWKTVFATILALLIIVLILRSVLERVEVEVLEMAPRTITGKFIEEGLVRAGKEYSVYVPQRGRILQLAVEEAERVEKDQLLALIDDQQLQYALTELKAHLQRIDGEEMKLEDVPGEAEIAGYELAIEQARVMFAAAERNYQRLRNLHEQDLISEERYEEARDRKVDLEYNLARAQKALATLHESYDPPPGSHEVIEAWREIYKAQIEATRYIIAEQTIRTPIAGVVGRLTAEEHEIIGPQAPLLTIFQDNDLEVVVDVLTRDIFDLEVGMPVKLLVEYRDEDLAFDGTISRIGAHAETVLSPLGLEERRVQVKISPSFPEDLDIRPGYEVDVEFYTEELEDRLVLPRLSVFRENGETAVMVVEDGRARLRRIKTGFSTDREIVVDDGLKAGDRVILNPRQDNLRENTRVRYRNDNPGKQVRMSH